MENKRRKQLQYRPTKENEWVYGKLERLAKKKNKSINGVIDGIISNYFIYNHKKI